MSERIAVALFVDRYAPGGTQRQMIELLSRLDRRHFRVHPVCFHTEGVWFERITRFDEPVALFPIHGFRRPATTRQLMAFARWCRDHRIQVLQTCELYSNVFGLPGGALASVPVRIGSRRGFVETPGLQRLQRLAYNAAHRIVANSHAAAERLRVEGVPRHKILVIPNGIEVSLFPARDYRRPPRTIAMVACLREEKRIDVLVAAAPRVLARHPEARILIVGEGQCRAALTEQIRQLGVADRVTLLGHRDDVPAVLAAADVFVLPSRSEAFPNAIMEAMASGLPVVASNVGGIPELVEEGRTGRLVPPGDPAALAGALLDVLGNPDRAAAFGRAGRAAVERTFGMERMVDRFESLYAAELDARLAETPVPRRGPKQVVKRAMMRTFLASGIPSARQSLGARLGRGRLTVLSYHQVNEAAHDFSTVSPGAFAQQMRFLRDHYRVLPLEEAVRGSGAGGEHVVAITFDDGYLDNATVAAPILEQLGLPATFFVSTNMIGTARPFPHDLVQRRPPQQHLSWDDLRALAARGFDIGSHTMNHADLGAVPLAEAELELQGSKSRLEAELGRGVRAFAFPYGHRRNMRPDTVAAAHRAYPICCSAYGGHNPLPADARNVRRVVISTGVSFLAFRAILEGWPMLRLNNPYEAPAVADQPAAS